MNYRAILASIAFALVAGVSTAFGQTQLYTNGFPNLANLATGGAVRITNPSEQLVLTSTALIPMPINNLVATVGTAYPPDLFPPAPLAEHQTLEMRVDLVGANQNDAFAYLQWWHMQIGFGRGYELVKDQDEIGLVKTWNDVAANAFLFFTNAPLKNQNVTLVLAFTRLGSDLQITSRVLDKDNANAVLFERTVTDTPQSDPVLPSGAVKGLLTQPDLVHSPWLLEERGNAIVGVCWFNTQRAPPYAAQVTFDNLEVSLYENPQLQIQNAVMLSWPVPQGTFVLESAPSPDGPWTAVPDPWSRTINGQVQVCVPAPDNMKVFRLRQTQ